MNERQPQKRGERLYKAGRRARTVAEVAVALAAGNAAAMVGGTAEAASKKVNNAKESYVLKTSGPQAKTINHGHGIRYTVRANVKNYDDKGDQETDLSKGSARESVTIRFKGARQETKAKRAARRTIKRAKKNVSKVALREARHADEQEQPASTVETSLTAQQLEDINERLAVEAGSPASNARAHWNQGAFVEDGLGVVYVKGLSFNSDTRPTPATANAWRLVSPGESAASELAGAVNDAETALLQAG